MSVTIVNKQAIQLIILGYFCVIFAAWIFYIIEAPTLLLFVFLIMSLVMLTLVWVSIGRKFILSDNSIVVSFLWISKEYSWKQFQIIQIFDGANQLGYRIPHRDGIVLSYRKFPCPRWIHPMQWYAIFCPFSTVVLNFSSSNATSKYYPAMYEIEKECIMQFLNNNITHNTGDGSPS